MDFLQNNIGLIAFGLLAAWGLQELAFRLYVKPEKDANTKLRELRKFFPEQQGEIEPLIARAMDGKLSKYDFSKIYSVCQKANPEMYKKYITHMSEAKMMNESQS